MISIEFININHLTDLRLDFLRHTDLGWKLCAFLDFSLISACPSSLFESFLSSRQCYIQGDLNETDFGRRLLSYLTRTETIFPPPPLGDLDTKHFF